MNANMPSSSEPRGVDPRTTLRWISAAASALGATAALIVANLAGWYIAAPRIIGAAAASVVAFTVLAVDAYRGMLTPPPRRVWLTRALLYFGAGLVGMIVLIVLVIVMMLLVPGLDGSGPYN